VSKKVSGAQICAGFSTFTVTKNRIEHHFETRRVAIVIACTSAFSPAQPTHLTYPYSGDVRAR
jgi:hypothetical protein